MSALANLLPLTADVIYGRLLKVVNKTAASAASAAASWHNSIFCYKLSETENP